MPLLRLNETRYIDTDHIADIRYTPRGAAPHACIVVVPAGEERPGAGTGVVRRRSREGMGILSRRAVALMLL